MTKVIVILGPTGVGKTKLSIELAKRYQGEIINADAMQVYQGLDIGTAKITPEEMQNIPHYLFNIKDVTANYSIYDYQKDSRKYLNDILSRGKTPIMVGGTGLYIKSSLYDYRFQEETTTSNYDAISTADLYTELKSKDPDSNIDSHNRRRIIRALDYFNNNHKSLSTNKTNTILYDTVFIGLTTDRKILYDLINKRVDQMVAKGLEQEVRTYYDQNIFTKPLLGGIGYKEFYEYFQGHITYSECLDLIKKNSRHYAKRQYTFFNNQLPVKWFTTDYTDFTKTVTEICNYLDSLE